mgnify:CR=1 FL=1
MKKNNIFLIIVILTDTWKNYVLSAYLETMYPLLSIHLSYLLSGHEKPKKIKYLFGVTKCFMTHFTQKVSILGKSEKPWFFSKVTAILRFVVPLSWLYFCVVNIWQECAKAKVRYSKNHINVFQMLQRSLS